MSVNKQLGDLLEQHMGPPVNIEAVIRGLGIELDKKAVLHDQISGQIERIEDGFRISANRADNYFRQRFTMAHGLAHLLLHRYRNGEMSSREEAEAIRLAVTILMPADLVRKECKDSASVDALAKRFQVSRRAMDMRLSTLGVRSLPPDDPRPERQLTPRPHRGPTQAS